MKEIKPLLGTFAVSIAGHDKGQIYVVIDQDQEYAYLCDGRLKPVNRPKKKKLKHIQVNNRKVNQELFKLLTNQETILNEEIKYAIKEFKKQ